MTNQTMDPAGKPRIRDALIAWARNELQASSRDTSTEQTATELDPDASYSIDDQWQSDEDGDLVGALEKSDARAQAVLNQIAEIDFGPKEVVEPGAVIAFNGDHYVVGVAVAGFECDGVSWEGISTDAPIYPVIEGLRAGARFTFNGREHIIDAVA